MEIGDYVRVEGHSFFVIDVQDGLATVTECNLNDDPCVIFWDTQYRLSEDGRFAFRMTEKGPAHAQKIESVSRMML